MLAMSDVIAATVSTKRRIKAARHWKAAHAHPVGSAHYAAHLRQHGAWVHAAQLAESGDLRPVTVTEGGELLYR